MPADLAVAGDQVYALQYDGSILAISTQDHGTQVIVPPVRQVADNEIPVDLETYNLVVTTDALYWTSNATGTPTVSRAALDGTGATTLDQDALAPFDSLVATTSGVCWTGQAAITCEHGVLAPGVTSPRALLASGPTLFFASEGSLLSVPVAGGDPQTLATGLSDVRALALASDQQMLWTDGGTRTCSDGLCTSNLDASLHTLSLAAPDAGPRVITNGYASIDDGLALAGDRVFFTSEARLRSRSLSGIEVAGQETLVSHATLACAALAVAGDELYCAHDNQIDAIAY